MGSRGWNSSQSQPGRCTCLSRGKHGINISDSLDLGFGDFKNDQEEKIRDKRYDKGYHKQVDIKYGLEFGGT